MNYLHVGDIPIGSRVRLHDWRSDTGTVAEGLNKVDYDGLGALLWILPDGDDCPLHSWLKKDVEVISEPEPNNLVVRNIDDVILKGPFENIELAREYRNGYNAAVHHFFDDTSMYARITVDVEEVQPVIVTKDVE